MSKIFRLPPPASNPSTVYSRAMGPCPQIIKAGTATHVQNSKAVNEIHRKRQILSMIGRVSAINDTFRRLESCDGSDIQLKPSRHAK
jgi:hypothetical protein